MSTKTQTEVSIEDACAFVAEKLGWGIGAVSSDRNDSTRWQPTGTDEWLSAKSDRERFAFRVMEAKPEWAWEITANSNGGWDLWLYIHESDDTVRETVYVRADDFIAGAVIRAAYQALHGSDD